MLFNSYVFLLAFLPAALIGWWAMRGRTARLLFLTLASYVFYGWWDWRFVPLMVASTSADFVAARGIDRATSPAVRRRWLGGLLVVNLGLLALFKYYDFFTGTLNGLAVALGLDAHLPLLHLVLPVGISFYTFNSISYTIDVYRRRIRPTANFLEFSAFVAFFPHLVAGPIIRYADIGPQFERPARRFDASEGAAGAQLFAVGLAKKILIADVVAASYVNPIFGSGAQGLADGWLAALAYAMQIYFDFSGYSDMAVGLSLLLGFRLPQNFDSPYRAASVADFWHRWHISLSSWIRDYLFIPLGGSRHGTARTLGNLAVVMALGGLWHGAAWTFVVWGLYHGALLALHALLGRHRMLPASRPLAVATTFTAVTVGWVFFRAPTLRGAVDMLAAMTGLRGLAAGPFARIVAETPWAAVVLGSALVLVFAAPNSWQVQVPRWRLAGAVLGALVALCVLFFAQPSPFLYFQF